MFIVAGIFAQNEPNVCVVCASLYVCVCACTFYWITQVWVWKIEQIFLATFEPLKWQPASGRNLISMDVYDLLNEYRIQQVHWIELDRIDSNELEFQHEGKKKKTSNEQNTTTLSVIYYHTQNVCACIECAPVWTCECIRVHTISRIIYARTKAHPNNQTVYTFTALSLPNELQ